MKITFIGGGRVQWTAKLVADMALNHTLDRAELVGEIMSDSVARGAFMDVLIIDERAINAVHSVSKASDGRDQHNRNQRMVLYRHWDQLF